MRKGWRAFAIFMAMVMVIAFLPTAAFAQDDGAVSDDAILDAENAVEGFDATETQEDDASDETDTVEDAGDMTETDEVDDSFGGFAGDDEFLVDDEFAEDELPVEDEVSTEDSELAEDEGISGEDSVAFSMARASGTCTYTANWLEITGGGSTPIGGKYTEDRGSIPTFGGADLTNDNDYMVVGYKVEWNNTYCYELLLPDNSSATVTVYVIDKTKASANINLEVQFVYKDENNENVALAMPQDYAISYSGTISVDKGSGVFSTYSTSGTLTAGNLVYSGFKGCKSQISFGEQTGLDIIGYKLVEEQPARVFASSDYYTVYEEDPYGSGNYVISTAAHPNWGATLTITNVYEEVPTYTVTWKDFDGNVFHTEKLNEDTEFPEEYKTSCPEGEPYNETYAFDGWNDPVRDTDGNYTITSEWIAPHAVKVEGRNESFVEQTVKHGEFALEPTYEITKEGHTFGGWELNGKPFDFATTPITEDNLEITINWIPEKRTVTWMNGETEVTKTEVDYGTAATAPELTAPEGYHLAGWTIAGEGGTAVDFDLETEITENITLSAKWIKQVTHTWMDGVNSEPLKTETADEGAEVTAPANPTRSGYTFNGWTSVTDEWGNVTYTAQWRANSSGGGGTGGGSIGGDNTGDNAGGDNTGGNGGETIGGGEGGEGSDPADENDPNSENGGLVDIDDENTALGDRPFAFIDVTKNDWFYDAVYAVWEKELMNGTTATTFEPSAMTTRGMLVTILYRMEGSPEVVSPNSFSDVAADMYYAKAVAWAAENGIVTGYDDETFGPEDVLLREQTAAILYRYAKYKGMDVATDGALEFDDADMIGGYAQDAMLWAVSVGLINGVDENTLAPKDGTERSHMATLLTRLVAMTEAKDDTKEG